MNFSGIGLHNLSHIWVNPSWTNVPRHTTISDLKIFISHIPIFEFCRNNREQITSHIYGQPILNQCPKIYYNFQIRKSLSHIPILNFAGAILHIIPRIRVNPSWTQRYIIKSQTLRFSSHTCLLNFAGTILHILSYIWSNLFWTNIIKYTTNFRSENLYLIHPYFELCRNSSPDYPTYVCQSWINIPKIDYITSDPRFSSHKSNLNFSRATLHITSRM